MATLHLLYTIVKIASVAVSLFLGIRRVYRIVRRMRKKKKPTE